VLKLKPALFLACLSLALSFTLSCSSDDPETEQGGKGNNIGDYRTVEIGNQTWMAENLDYAVQGSKCYDNDPANCAKYGRLYDWATAMGIDADFNWDEWDGSDVKHKGICPTGWHLPSNDDWDELFLYVDSQNDGEGSGGSPYDSYTAGKYLKATDGWNWNDYEEISGNGTDKYGFSALPGGYGNSDGNFSNAGNYGYWWSASENNSYGAYYRYMNCNYEYAYWGNSSKSLLFSVRCLQD
jgi:uncharacterized protein (TIGR02145 family)